jgi:two-component system, OmpR family, sensor histidine kinase CiaH
VEWAIASQEKYKSDLFFRTTLQVVLSQGLLVVVCIGAFAYTLINPDQSLLVLFIVVILSIIGGILVARFTLRPARDTLRYQKLFISNVAHELRTPLSVIKTSTEVGLIDPTLSQSARTNYNDILVELDRVSEIINNLLSLNTLTRPERMQFKDVALEPLITDVVHRHAVLAGERSIKVEISCQKNTSVWGNTTALEQIIANLVKNAISYTPRGSQTAVEITTHLDGDMVVLGVSDGGIGISEEDLFHIFEPFYRADMSRVRKIKKVGSGLGLTIVNEMVRVHHGKIQIQSKLRKGTKVWVYLPRSQQKTVSASASSVLFSSPVQSPFVH